MPVDQVVARVFAPGTRIARSAGPSTRAHVVISGPAGPRWLLPARAGTAAAFLASWSPYRPMSRLSWRALRLAHCLGALPWMPGTRSVQIEPPEVEDWSHLGWTRARAPWPVVHIGSPVQARKVVAALLDPSNAEIPAIAKIALADAARPAIAHEADMLTRLAVQRPGLAPRVLHADAARGVLTLAPVDGRPVGRAPTAALTAWLETLRMDDRCYRIGTDVEALKSKIAAKGLTPPEAVASALARLPADSRMPAVWEHGDLAPWNLKRLPNDTLVALDWEEARAGGAPLHDLFYFLYTQAVLLDHGGGLDVIARHRGMVQRLARALDVARDHLDDLLMLFFLREWVKRSFDGEHGHADMLARDLAERARIGTLA